MKISKDISDMMCTMWIAIILYQAKSQQDQFFTMVRVHTVLQRRIRYPPVPIPLFWTTFFFCKKPSSFKTSQTEPSSFKNQVWKLLKLNHQVLKLFQNWSALISVFFCLSFLPLQTENVPYMKNSCRIPFSDLAQNGPISKFRYYNILVF